MSDKTAGSSLLYELAQTMVGQEDYPTAIALRKLARAGYATMEQVDSISDWVLLATPGIGINRLTAVRRLVRPDWQPPRSRTIKVAERFLASARFALRFWPIEELEAVIRGSVSLPADVRPVEKRLSLEQFAQATRRALRHCEAEAWVLALQQIDAGQAGVIAKKPGPAHSFDRQIKRQENTEDETPAVPSRGHTTAGRETDHYAYTREKRWEIVQHYRAARESGEVDNKDRWARTHHHISGRTLLSYEREFPRPKDVAG